MFNKFAIKTNHVIVTTVNMIKLTHKKIIPIMEICIEMSYFHQVLYVFHDWKYCTQHLSI